jgi:RHS repeat-associated protein
VTDTYDYDAFGNVVNQTGSTPGNYLFAGEQYDPALGLYYNRARYLNTATGRFWSMDTYKGDKWRPTTLHRYSYSWNNPPNVVDPSGMDGDIATLAVDESVSVVEDTESTVEAEPYIEAFEEPEEVAQSPQTASGFQQAIAYLLIGTAALGTAAGVGGTGDQVPIDQEVAEASQGNYDIYRLGNSTKLNDLMI